MRAFPGPSQEAVAPITRHPGSLGTRTAWMMSTTTVSACTRTRGPQTSTAGSRASTTELATMAMPPTAAYQDTTMQQEAAASSTTASTSLATQTHLLGPQ